MIEQEERTGLAEVATKPDGPAAAAVVAAGVGAFTLGLMTTLAEASTDVRGFLDFSKNFGLGVGVGPLSGKVAIAVIAYLASWTLLYLVLRRREVSFGRAFLATLILVGLGFALTFPPIFVLFAPPEG
jgi:hypothetical protein